MQSLREPLERLVEELRWFATATEVCALHVHTTDAQRLSVLQHIAAEEHFPGNRSPYFVIESGVEGADLGWEARVAELKADHESLREACANAEPPIEVPALRAVASRGGLGAFASTLLSVMQTLPPPLEGLVVALSPVWVKDERAWVRDVTELLRQPALSKVRWILVDAEGATLLPLVESLGPRGLRVDARMDPADAQRDLNAMMAQMKDAPAGASPAQLAGGAGPRVAPPRRWDAPTEETLEVRAARLVELGVPAGLADQERLRSMQVSILSAASSVRDGDFEGAVRHQTDACEQAKAAGLGRETLVMELVRAGYLIQGGAVERAGKDFESIRDRALAADEGDLAVQAQLALAASWLLRQRRGDAAAAYAEAGRLGASSGSTVLGIEGFRMSGQLLLEDRKLEQGATALRRALEVAAAGEVIDRSLSSAADVARSLARVCRDHGLRAQAESLEQQAATLDAETAAMVAEATAGQAGELAGAGASETREGR